MPYHKDKQQAFQAAQQGVKKVDDIYQEIVKEDSNYANQLSHLINDANAALQQIENALEVASETQKERLEQFRNDVSKIDSELNTTE